MSNVQKGDTGIITYGDKTIAKVRIHDIRTYPATGMPADVLFTYLEGETNKKIVHPTMGEVFPIPESVVHKIFTPDSSLSHIPSSEDNDTKLFNKELNEYIDSEFNPEDRPEARKLFARLVHIAGRDHVRENHLKTKSKTKSK